MYHPDTFYSQQLLVSNSGKFVMLLWSLRSRIGCLCFLPAFICIFKYKSFLYSLGFKYGRAGEWPWTIWAHILYVPKCHWVWSVGELRLVLLRVVQDYFWYFLGGVILAVGMSSSYFNWELSSLLCLVELLAIKTHESKPEWSRKTWGTTGVLLSCESQQRKMPRAAGCQYSGILAKEANGLWQVCWETSESWPASQMT